MQVKTNFLMEAMQARLAVGRLPEEIELKVGTDSRRIEPGMIFLALPGESYDGHDYVVEALEKGVKAAVVSRMPDISVIADGAALLQVDDVQEAMQSLAAAWLQAHRVVSTAVTGSVGKTTTKDLTAHFLGTRYRTLKTQANFNNDIGLPLTVFGLREEHERAVFEMAMRGPGEIQRLARVVKPHYAIITNVAPVHLETLGSLEAITAAKCEVLAEMTTGGTGIVNADQEFLVAAARESAARAGGPQILTFGWNEGCDAQVIDVLSHPKGMRMEFDIAGHYLVLDYPIPAPMLAPNFAAAALCVHLQGVLMADVRASLQGFAAADKRLNITNFKQGGAVINDSYNASPLSMSAALGTLMIKADGRRTIAVLGDMNELGSMEEPAHLALGQEAAQCGLDLLVCIGEKARDIARGALAMQMPADRVRHFVDRDSAVQYLQGQIGPGDFVLFKASRAMHLDQLAELFTHQENQQRS